ncbi:MAG: DUF5670 family protein [Chryseolinea sp.]
MNQLLYVVAVILLTVWMVGIFIYTLGLAAHIILLLALVPIIFLAKRENKAV